MRERKENIIICPSCGQEYLPGEIYIPDYFLGKPDTIEREDGQIIGYGGIVQDLKEEYTCDRCQTRFSVNTFIKFKVEEVEEFNEEFTSPLLPTRYILDEDGSVEEDTVEDL